MNANQTTAPAADTRLTGLYKQWRETAERKAPDSADDDESERFYDRLSDAMIKLEGRIISIPAEHIDDAYIQFGILKFWGEDAAPASALPAYGKFKKRVDARLAEIVGD